MVNIVTTTSSEILNVYNKKYSYFNITYFIFKRIKIQFLKYKCL